jgi:pilus assembly protein CpaB
MDKRKIILLVGALIVALGTAFLARSLFTGSSAPQVDAAPMMTQNDGPHVLVANRSLAVGTIITPESVNFQPWPSELVENAYFLQETTDAESLLGTVVRHPLSAGQPVTQGSLVRPGDRGFLLLLSGLACVLLRCQYRRGQR